LLPEAGWLSEETRDDAGRLSREWVWIVDPLDGTKEYASGVAEYAVSIGLVHVDRVVAGGVLNPATGEGAVAVDGVLMPFGMPPLVQPPADLSSATAVVSRTEMASGSAARFARCVGQIVPMGSVAYKLLRVAARANQLTYSAEPKSEWDICGGVALIEAAGLRYRRLDGRPLLFNQRDTRVPSGAVAGPVDLVEAFLECTGRD